MSHLAADLAVIRFRQGEREQQRTPKLEKLRLALVESQAAPNTINFSITDLASADPAVPLVRFRVHDVSWTFGTGYAEAGVAATGAPSLPIQKNGIDVGSISYAGTVGTVTFSDPAFASDDLFEIYPPAAPDPTLDQLSVSLAVTIV